MHKQHKWPKNYRIVVTGQLEKAKKRWIIVPTEDDMAALAEDIDRFGIPVLVGLLLVLSALHYPRHDDMPTSDVAEKDPAPPSHELFIDDPDIPRGLPEEDEEL